MCCSKPSPELRFLLRLLALIKPSMPSDLPCEHPFQLCVPLSQLVLVVWYEVSMSVQRIDLAFMCIWSDWIRGDPDRHCLLPLLTQIILYVGTWSSLYLGSCAILNAESIWPYCWSVICIISSHRNITVYNIFFLCFTDERDRVQKKTFTKWVNKHLIKVIQVTLIDSQKFTAVSATDFCNNLSRSSSSF